MSASNDYCLGKFKIVMTKIINYLYECTWVDQKIKLPWKKLSQKEIEKVFGRVVGTDSARQPGALPEWLLTRFPKIKWQLDNEGNLQVDLYHAAYACLCLDLTIISTASRRIEALPRPERHIVGYVLGGLEKMDKTDITLDILQELVVESVNEASTITPDNSIEEPYVGPTPKTKLIDSLRTMNRDLLADLSGTRGDRNDAEHERDQLKQQLDRQQASHLNEVAKLKARVADLENLSQKIQLSLDDKSGKLTVLESQLVDRQKNYEDVALSQRKVIADLEAEVDEKNRLIATLRIRLDKQKNMVIETPLLASGSNQDVPTRDAQTSFHRDSLPADDTESTINITMEAPNNLAAEMMQLEINEFKQTVERQKLEIQQLRDENATLKNQIAEKEKRRQSISDRLENIHNEMKRKSIAAKTQYEQLVAECEENIRKRQREVEEWKSSRDIYVRRWAEEKKISQELYRRAQLAAIIENPDDTQTDDASQAESESIASTSNANNQLIDQENISETSADIINLSVAGVVDLTADDESDDDENASQAALDATDSTIEELSEDRENASQAALDATDSNMEELSEDRESDVSDVSTDEESESNANPNDSYVPAKIPNEAFFVSAIKVDKKVVDNHGYVFKRSNPSIFPGANGPRWICVGADRTYCPVRLFSRQINGQFKCYATERLEHNHEPSAEVPEELTN